MTPQGAVRKLDKATPSAHLVIPWSTSEASRRVLQMADMDTVEGAASGRRPGQQKQGVSHRGNGRVSSKENLSVKEKGGDRHPSERQREKQSMETQEGSQGKAGKMPDSFLQTLFPVILERIWETKEIGLWDRGTGPRCDPDTFERGERNPG